MRERERWQTAPPGLTPHPGLGWGITANIQSRGMATGLPSSVEWSQLFSIPSLGWLVGQLFGQLVLGRH